ncbi:programmed cell death protein 1 [Lepus europaeus]|uniref:programmed cell death protein 1 n=1 Tax=Lepus europaeus TaxID=9983 RepID=UPI002B492793|nr:programmed cell death protein 1 [Lepus europaeus]
MRVPWAPWSLLWAMLQLSWWPGCLLGMPGRPPRPPSLTFSPAQATVPEGANVTFTCSFSNTSEHFVLNWYRLSPSNQRDKLAAFPEDRSRQPQDSRFRITRLPDGSGFHMSGIGVRRNDSGIYLCGAISLHPTQIKESPQVELTVTERLLEPSTAQPSPSPRPPGQLQGLVIGVPSVLVGVLLLLLLAWVLVATCPRTTQEAEGPKSQDQPLKEKPSALPGSTMDYGELDFQWREKTPEPPATSVPEQTEYATIVFPDGLGASSPGRRGSTDCLRGPRPLRSEDGHCSWPL